MITVLRQRYGLHAVMFTAVWLVAMVIAVQSWAQPKIVILGGEARHAGEFVIPINKSQVLQIDVPFEDLLVGNSEIADVLALTDRSIYVLGKALGSTSLTIYGRNKSLIAVMDLVVSPDIDGLKLRLFELMPEENIEIRPANGALILSGTVSSAGRISKVLDVAERYAPGLVTNLLAVEGSQQVMLKVRFVEVSREVSKELGFNALFTEGEFSLSTGIGLNLLDFAIPSTPFATGAVIGANIGAVGFNLLFDALEVKGLSKTLAEPNLIALSGETASFLAGGEFPFETSESATFEGAGGDELTISSVPSVTFKNFGVFLEFTPTVLDDGLINLVVNPEVATLDFTSVSRSGNPARLIRAATTTVELRDGQTFAIAGLLSDDFSDSISQFPLLGEIPILGALFRSSTFKRNETELVIIVEVHLVKPAPIGALATPADNFIPPSEPDIWLFGRIEAPGSGIPAAGALSAEGAGGIDGHYGHIIK